MPRGVYNRNKKALTPSEDIQHLSEDEEDIVNELELDASIKKHEGSKYLRTIPSADGGSEARIDVYCVLEAFKITCPAVQHAVKKLLAPGQRGKGSALDDLVGAKAAVERAIELERRRENNRNR